MRPERALLTFAASLAVFHHLPAFAGRAGDWIDLVTPAAVVGASAAVLAALGARVAPLGVAAVAAVLYVDGHGIHLAANSIAREPLAGEVEQVAHFWDEQFSHLEWHLGWIGLVVAFCLAESARGVSARSDAALGASTVLLLGFTLFTSTVEGGTWWLELAATALLVPWAARARRPLVVTCATAFGVAALLIGVWALWHRGVPEFSELGWI